MHPPSRLTVQYLALALTWGMSFLFIKVGLEALSPGQVVLGRMASGAAALAVVLVVRRQRPPRQPIVWLHLTVVAVTLCVVPFLLFAWAEQRIDSGLASVLNATTPLMTMLVALLALRQERLGWARAAGLVVGFSGVVLVVAPEGAGTPSGAGDVLAKLACVGATACYGVAFVWLRRFIAPRGLPAVTVAAVQVGLGTGILLLLSPWLATGPATLHPRAILAILALGILGSGLAYVWNTNVVAAWGAVRASTVTYLTPLVGVIAGAALLRERVTAATIAGGAVIVLGVTLTNGVWSPLLGRLAPRPSPDSPVPVGLETGDRGAGGEQAGTGRGLGD